MVNISNNTLSFFRFGLVVALKTIKDVKKGEEFLVNYQYPYKMGPKWYKKLFKASAKKNPAIKNQLKHLLHNVDLDTVDNELNDANVLETSSINNDIGIEEEDELPETPVTERPTVAENLLGTTYWY